MSALTSEQNIAFVTRWRSDIPAFSRFMFSAELRLKQLEFCEAFRNNQQITFKGGVGFGKTRALATIILWGAVCFDNIQISVYGPTEQQLDSGLWKELRILFNLMPEEYQEQFELNTTRLVRKGSVACLVEKKVANRDNPEANRGIHMRNNWMIVDEASGVDDRVIEVLFNVLSDGAGAKICLISNPTRASGYFFDTFEHPDKSKDWVKISGKATDNPDLTPETLKRMVNAWGGPTSKLTRINVDGEFPLSDDGGIIPMDLVLAAAHAEGVEAAASAPVIWGLDVGGPHSGSDRSVLVKRKGSVVVGIETWQGLDPHQLANAVKQVFDRTPKEMQPKAICVDGIGIGEGVHANLSAMALPSRRVAVSNKPTRDPDKFSNLRAQLWWTAREWFEEGGRSIPNDTDLVSELCLPKFDYARDKIKVEEKKEIRKRGRKSPDIADAFCLTFAVNDSTLSNNSKWSWGKPIDYGSMAWAQ